MKKIVLLIFIFSLFSLYAKDDLTNKPEPLEKTNFQFPNYSVTTLKNGLKVFVVEDHEQPTVALRFIFAGGNSVDGDKPGKADVFTDMLQKGTEKRTAVEIANAIDDVGAHLSVNSSIDYITLNAGCLKKHLPVVLDVVHDILTNPTFPKDEFKKLIPQSLAALKNEKSSPHTLTSWLVKKVIYGENHPYGKVESEESLKSLTVDDIKDYYKTYIMPNNGSLVVTGDITEKEIVKKLDKLFDSWQPGTAPTIKIPPLEPKPLGVYFIDRPGSVQSSITFVTNGVTVNSNDYIPLQLSSEVIGAGFAGRLFRTLREKYSYTYTPFGMIGKNKYANVFACGADVRNAVTDSSIDVINNQLQILCKEPPSDSELTRLKNYEVGQYELDFENAGFIASLVQDADFNNIPLERLKNKAELIIRVSPYDITRMAAKFMNPATAYIFVVGNPEVKDKLVKYGKLYEYDLNLNPLTGEGAKMEKVSLSPEELIDKYVDAIGGKQAIENIRTMVIEAKAKLLVRGKEMPGTLTIKWKDPNKKYQLFDLGMMKQSMWVNGTDAWVGQSGSVKKEEGRELEKALEDAEFFMIPNLLKLGFKCEVLGKNKDEILMKATSSHGLERTYYFNAITFLLDKSENTEKTPQGPIPVTETYENYQKVDSILLPMLSTTSNPIYDVTIDYTYKPNEPIEDGVFSPPEKKN